jgi:hypothetical protein
MHDTQSWHLDAVTEQGKPLSFVSRPHTMMPSRLQALADMLVESTYNDSLLSLSEGFIKVRCIEAGLSLGWTIQEGAGRRPDGDVADYAVKRNGKIVWHRATRKLRLEDGSSDVAVVDPFEMLLEIKARPDYGTKSQAQFQQMDADVERVAKNPKCALFVVFDPRMYLSFSGEKTEARGRPAVASEWFVGSFPKLEKVPYDHCLLRLVPRGPTKLLLGFRRCRHSSSGDTITVFGAREDSSVIREAD